MTGMGDEKSSALAVAELRGDIRAIRGETEAMEARIDASLARLREDMAKRDTDAARRDKDNLRWVVGFGIAQMVLILAVVGAGFTVIGLLIT